MSAPTAAPAAPPHVPAALIKDYPLVLGRHTSENPYERIIPDIHRNLPEVFYSLNAYPGGSPAWILRRADDLRQVYNDTTNFTSAHFSPFAGLIGETWNLLPAETDPPMHGKYRTMLNPLFAPKKMQAMEGSVRAAARRSIDKLAGRRECEFLTDFAFPFPVSVFLDLIDLPQSRMKEFQSWEYALLHVPDMQVVAAAVRNVVGYLREVMAERRRSPGDDFISYAVKAEIDGRKLTDDELIGYCFNLFIGGLDTVSSNVTMQFRHLAEHPQHQARLRSDPSLIPAAVEELLRAYAVVTTFRTCVNETQIRGVTIKPGDKVAMSTTLANRDPEEFDAPDEVRLDRQPTHVSFAYGPHRCIGSHLARREMVIAMEEFLSAIPAFRLKPGVEIITHLGGIIQPNALQFIW
jgi:cytochrome P450